MAVQSKFLCMVYRLIVPENFFTRGVASGLTNLIHAWTFDNGTVKGYTGNANGTLLGSAEIYMATLFDVQPDLYMEISKDQNALNIYNETVAETSFCSIEDVNICNTVLVYYGNIGSTVGNGYYFFIPARDDDKTIEIKFLQIVSAKIN